MTHFQLVEKQAGGCLCSRNGARAYLMCRMNGLAKMNTHAGDGFLAVLARSPAVPRV